MSISNVMFEFDSEVVASLVTVHFTHDLPYKHLLHAVLKMLDSPDWVTSVAHVFSEGNRSAYLLANMVHTSNFTWTILEEPPPPLQLVLSEDAHGACLPRSIYCCSLNSLFVLCFRFPCK